MKLLPTSVAGAFVIELEPVADERGLFIRSFCAETFRAHGLDARVVQCNISFSPQRGTLRGMHYQTAPHAETKLIRCTRGSLHDVIVDLRADSPSFRRWHATRLSAGDPRLLYVPEGCAHGLLTLTDDCEVSYQISQRYHAESARGVRWDDPAFGIEWPEAPRVVSARDRGFPDFTA
ncbi:MAG: dTDP-4-dehydrorhamnose 3,5-epimerase [Burkholderiales bacterium]